LEKALAKQYLARLLAVGLMVISASLPYSGEAVAQDASCNRSCLQGFVDQYLDALSRRDPSGLPVADSFKYTENGRALALGQGLWHTAGKPWSYRDYVLDSDAGAALVLTALDEYDGVAQLALRLKIVNKEITEIETMVARVGDQRWFAPETLKGLSDIFAESVPPAERHTREELEAAADAYFTAIQTEGTPEFRQAPFGPHVKRFENGFQTTYVTENPVSERHRLSPAEQLERAAYKGTMVMDRRFPLVDVERGIAVGIGAFRREGEDSTTLLLCEIFKVTGGQIQEIRAIILDLPRGASTGWR
jgi:hypothetical protein